MSDFHQFAKTVSARLTTMSAGELYTVGHDKDAVWDAYLESFPAGTNPLFRERTEHDCSTCRQFVKGFGNVVEIVNNEVRTIWDDVEIVSPTYAKVAASMADYIRSLPLSGLFRSSERQYGTEVTHGLYEGVAETWHHFYGRVADKHFTHEVGTARGNFDAAVQVFRRGLEELDPSAAGVVIDLIDSGSLYRGEEHLRSISAFRTLQNRYSKLSAGKREAFVFANANNQAARFRNTVIGTLIQDLSTGVELERAVASFESKVAPTNYKRPKALITPAMVKSAMKTITELGIEDSLKRRFARLSDVSVNNVLWVSGEARSLMKDDGIADILMAAAKPKPLAKGAKPEEVTIEQFMKDILPSAEQIDVLVKNSHANNFVSITTAEYADAPGIFKWNNNFGWSYGGNVTDSIREKVKTAGGSVTGKMRVSLAWFNTDDLDLHLYEPDGTHIWYGDQSPGGFYRSSKSAHGELDVDMNAGGHHSREPVENVTWNAIQDGEYTIKVNQYTQRNSSNVGFVIETESNGVIQNYKYEKLVSGTITAGTMTVRNGVIESFKPGKDIQGGSISQDMWGIKTEDFVSVSTVMHSPNHWDSNEVGNKHYFFILKGCINDQPTRGIYNEFLRGDLDQHRKAFEVLGDKTKVAPSDDQLSGVGFSSTAGSSITARVQSGTRQRLVTIKF